MNFSRRDAYSHILPFYSFWKNIEYVVKNIIKRYILFLLTAWDNISIGSAWSSKLRKEQNMESKNKLLFWQKEPSLWDDKRG